MSYFWIITLSSLIIAVTSLIIITCHLIATNNWLVWLVVISSSVGGFDEFVGLL